MEGSTNLNLLFFTWWYTEAYARLFVFLKHFFLYLIDLFSVKICLRTLFYPWKRDQINTEGMSIQDRFQALMMNLVSRLVGFVIKTGTLVSYCCVTAVSFALSIVLIAGWFLYPILIVGLIFYGIKILVGQ